MFTTEHVREILEAELRQGESRSTALLLRIERERARRSALLAYHRMLVHQGVSMETEGKYGPPVPNSGMV